MFKTLLIKEWKEKALIAVFGLGLMVIFLAAFFVFGNNQDLRDLIPAAFLIIFFPFIGLMLGAGAFESEFRNGSWAFLLSRPVRKETIWLAKLTALLSIMAAFWLVFIGLMAVVPGLGEVVRGFRFPEILDVGLEVFPLMLLSSAFYFSVAFSLSVLSERQLSLVFGSLFLGFALQAVLSYFAFQAGGRGLLSHAGFFPSLDAYKLALVLSSLAFLGASLITFRKADFSQPKTKAASLARYSLLFVALAWLLSAAWPALRPGPREEIESEIEIVAGEAFFSTTRGLYRYDIAGDELRKIARWRYDYPYHLIGGGKVIYAANSNEFEPAPLRVMSTDGSGKKLLIGNDQDGPATDDYYRSYILSPDGQTVIIIANEDEGQARRTAKRSLWSVRTDGTSSQRLPPLDPALDGRAESPAWLMPIAWLKSSEKLLIKMHSQEGLTSLWTYDLTSGAQARLIESPRLRFITVSPVLDFGILVLKPESRGPFRLALLDLTTGEMTDAEMTEFTEQPVYSPIIQAAWSRQGDRVAFLFRNARGIYSPAIYSLTERRVLVAKAFQTKESSSQEPSDSFQSVDWVSGDTKLVTGVSTERCLKILDRELAEEKTIAVPAEVGKLFMASAAGDVVLVQDYENDSVWRLDLKTEKWKKIW